MGDGFAQTNRVPVDDDCGEQVEAGDAVVLTLRRPAGPDLAPAADSLGALQRMTGLWRPILVRGCMPVSSAQSIMTVARTESMRRFRPPTLRQVIRTILKRNTYSWPNQVQRDFKCLIRGHPRRIQSAFQPNSINRRIDGYCESSNIVGRRRFAFDGVDPGEAISQFPEKEFISLGLYRRHVAVRDQQRQEADPYLHYSSSCFGLAENERRRKGFEPFDRVCSGTLRLGNVRRHRTSPEVPVRLTHQFGLAAEVVPHQVEGDAGGTGNSSYRRTLVSVFGKAVERSVNQPLATVGVASTNRWRPSTRLFSPMTRILLALRLIPISFTEALRRCRRATST